MIYVVRVCEGDVSLSDVVLDKELNMGELLSKKEAIEYTGLHDKMFGNYLIANEFSCIERKNGRGRYYFDKDTLSAWLKDKESRTVTLNLKDYAICLDFALAQHFRHYVASDFGTGRQREFGQKITNWVKGQLGEVAVRKFFSSFGTEIELDFNLHDEIVPQDIVGVMDNGKIRKPKIGVGIKSSKPKNVFLVLGENEITREDRRSDIYIFCRPDIPDDHILRVAKNAIQDIVHGMPHYDKYKTLMPDFAPIVCEIVGWCRYEDLKQANEIPGQKFEGVRYVKASGELKRGIDDWRNLISRI